MIKKALFLATFSYSFYLFSAQILVSNLEKLGESFPFNILAHGLYIPLGRLFVGASEKVDSNDFAVAAAHRGTTTFKGLTPASVTLNNEKEQDNPLHGAEISHLALLGSRPVVAKTDLPSSLFLIDDATKQILVFEAPDIQDAQGEKVKSLLALATSAQQVFTPLEAGAQMAVFAAVGNGAGNFDGNGSGIALLFLRRFTHTTTQGSFLKFDAVDAHTGASQCASSGETHSGGNKARAVGKDTPEIMIEEPVSALGNSVDLHYDRDLGRLYCALQVQAGADLNAGARALLIASVNNGKLLFQSIAPDTAIIGNEQIVGGRGIGENVSIHKVRTLQTRTYLRYLIVVGGNGNDESLKRQVLALPLVDNIRSPFHGALANVRRLPITLFSAGEPHRFQARVFHVPAQEPEDLYTKDSEPARVGGDGVLPSAITDIEVGGEAVFVSVAQDGEELKAGLFYSQPLFDEHGRICRWTRWQRVAGTDRKIAGFAYDPLVGTFDYIPQMATPQGVETHTVMRTTWSNANETLSQLMSREFAQLQGGVQHLQDFSCMTSGFSTSVGQRLAVQLYAGYKKLILLQTGRDTENFFGPFLDLRNLFTSTDGTLQGFSQASGLVFSGGSLEEIGPIGASAVAADGQDGWFIIGGSCGIAVLSDAQGRGWDAGTGLASDFKGLSSSMAWRKISNVPNVRKLISVGNKLFVLTDEKLMRFEVTAQAIAQGHLPADTIARAGTLPNEQASFSDVLISGPLGLLATSFGLLRSGDAIDVQTVPEDSARWTPIELPEAAGSLSIRGPVSRFFAISPTHDERDVAQKGNVYLLNAYVGLSQAQIYRLRVHLEGGVVMADTVKLFPDLFIKDNTTFFANLGDYRNYLVTDGALIAVSRSAFSGDRLLLELVSPTLKSGESNGTRGRVPFVVIREQAFSMGKLMRSSASGAWMVPGDFGVRIQE